ncbi:MAG: hypothetical protein ACLT76_18640 [Clostridium fessum]
MRWLSPGAWETRQPPVLFDERKERGAGKSGSSGNPRSGKSCFRELSGGQKQRVLTRGRFCATDKLLILDEPITGLDPSAILDFYQLIRKLNQKKRLQS